MGSLMDSFLEGMAEGSGMTEEEKKKMMEPVKGFKSEIVEENGHQIEKMTVRGNKGVFFAFKDYITNVTVTDNTDFCVSNKKTSRSFTKYEIVRAEYKFMPLITPMDIIRYIVAVALCFFMLPAGIVLAIVSFIASMIKTVKVTLSDNTTVKIYCKRNEVAEYLINKFVQNETKE